MEPIPFDEDAQKKMAEKMAEMAKIAMQSMPDEQIVKGMLDLQAELERRGKIVTLIVQDSNGKMLSDGR